MWASSQTRSTLEGSEKTGFNPCSIGLCIEHNDAWLLGAVELFFFCYGADAGLQPIHWYSCRSRFILFARRSVAGMGRQSSANQC
jgi:hypothetical protein